MTFREMHVKWSVILVDQLGPETLTMLEINGQVLHPVGLHLKVPGWLSGFKMLFRKKVKVTKISSQWLLSLIYEGSDLTMGFMTLSK